MALYRLEVTATPGTGKLRTPAGLDRGLKESLLRAHAYLQSVKDRLGLAPLLALKDLIAEAVDLTGGRVECECGVAFYLAMLSALQDRRLQPGTVVLGDLTIQGNLRALVPLGNKSQFATLPEEVVEKMDLVFFGDPERAASKALEG